MRTRNETNPLWIRVVLAWSLFLASAGVSHAMGASLFEPGTQEGLGAKLRTAAIVVFRSLRTLTLRLGVEFDLAAADDLAVDSRDFLQQLSGVTGHAAPCEHPCGDCVPNVP